MSSITIVSDAPNCGVAYDCHYEDCNSFIIQATGKNDSLLNCHSGKCRYGENRGAL